MIRYLYYLAAVLLLVIIQTSVLNYMPAFFRFYDLLIPLAVYFSLYAPLKDGFPVVISAGIVMDMLSGAPIGIYLTAYLWVFLAFRRVYRWVGIRDHLLFSMLVVAGVLFENLIFTAAAAVGSSPGLFNLDSLKTVLFQVFWAVVTAPFLWLGFKYCFSAAAGTRDEAQGR